MALQNKYELMSNTELANELLTHNLYTGETPRDKEESRRIIGAIADRLTSNNGRTAHQGYTPNEPLVSATWEFHVNPLIVNFTGQPAAQMLAQWLVNQQEHNPLVNALVIKKIMSSFLIGEHNRLLSTLYGSDMFITVTSTGDVKIDLKAKSATQMFVGGMMPQFNLNPGFVSNRPGNVFNDVRRAFPDGLNNGVRFGPLGSGFYDLNPGALFSGPAGDFAPGTWDNNDDAGFPPKLVVSINDLVGNGLAGDDLLDVFNMMSKKLEQARAHNGEQGWAENIGTPESVITRFKMRLDRSKTPYTAVTTAAWLVSLLQTHNVVVKVFTAEGPVSVEVTRKLANYGSAFRAPAMEFRIDQEALKAPNGVLADIQVELEDREAETNPLLLWPQAAGTAGSVFRRIKEAISKKSTAINSEQDIESWLRETLENTPLFVQVFDAEGPIEVNPLLRRDNGTGSSW